LTQPVVASAGYMPMPTGDPRVDEFVALWGLDAQAQATLMSLEPNVRLRVVTSFNPPPNTRSIPACFMRFCKIVSGAVNGGPTSMAPSNEAVATGRPEIDDFISKWGLDLQCQKLLMSLDVETQQRLTKAFSPPEGTRKPSALFMTFAKNHVTSMSHGGRGQGQLSEVESPLPQAMPRSTIS